MNDSMNPKPTAEQLKTWDRTLVWHAFTQMAEYEPLVIERAEGCTLFDIDGNAYLDGVSSLWCNIHGHRHPRLDAALRAQLDRVAHVTNLGSSNPAAIRLARRLVDLAPAGLGHVFFSDDGATAVEVALKMAFQYWRQRRDPRPEKTCYLALGDAYHGDTLGSVSVGGVERFHAMFRPLLFETLRLPMPDTYRTPAGVLPAELAAYHLEKLEQVLRAEHRRIAAMVIEPLVQAAAGMVMHPAGYLRGVRELTRKYDVLLIADEVAVGMGRTGRMFACEHEQVAPDLLCLAKGLTGGYLPLAATLASEELWQAFLGEYAQSRTFFHGHTYGGNRAGGGRGAGHAGGLRGRADPGPAAGEDRPPLRAPAADRRLAAGGPRPPVRADRGDRIGPPPRDQGALSLGGAAGAARLRLCPRRGRLAASAGQRAGGHAAAGDLAGRARPHCRRGGARHRGEHLRAGAGN